MSRDQIKDWSDELMRRVVLLSGDTRLNQEPYYSYGMDYHSSAQPVFPRVRMTIDTDATFRSLIHSWEQPAIYPQTNPMPGSPGCLYTKIKCKVYDNDHDGNSTTQNILNLVGVIFQCLITDSDDGGPIRRLEDDVDCRWYSKLCDGEHTHMSSDCFEFSMIAEIPLNPGLYVTSSIHAVSASVTMLPDTTSTVSGSLIGLSGSTYSWTVTGSL